MKAILIVLSAITLMNLSVRFVPDTMAWDFFAFIKQSETAILSMLIVFLIPYRNLAAKSIMFIWFITEVVDLYGYGFWLLFEQNFLYLYGVKATLCFGALTRFWFRNYERENDELDEEHFFMVGIRPASVQEFLVSLIKEPVGGVGIYVQGKFYHYRKGVLQVHDRKYLEKTKHKYRIQKVRPVDEERMKVLESLVGGKCEHWSMLYNCITVLEPILSERAKPFLWR